jgi:hypothetical protein
MIYYGHGGFNFDDLYTMPVYLRNFYLKLMIDTKKKEKEEQEKANKGESAPSSKKQSYGPAVNRIPKG